MLVGIGVLLSTIMTVAVMVMLYFLKGQRQDQSNMWHKLSHLETDLTVVKNDIEHLSTDISDLSEYIRDWPNKGGK